jgi:hypothetical protein
MELRTIMGSGKSYLVGRCIGSLAVAAFMIGDAMPGNSIFIPETLQKLETAWTLRVTFSQPTLCLACARVHPQLLWGHQGFRMAWSD